MPPNLQSVLAGIPGYSGYRAASEMNASDNLDTLKQASALQTILAQAQTQQQSAQMRDALATSGGDVEKALAAAVQSGNLAGAHQLAPLVKMAQERKMNESLFPGGAGQNLGALTADQADALATKAAMLNHPGAVGFAKLAELKRAQADKKEQIPLMQGQPTGLPAGATVGNQTLTEAIPPEDVAAFAKVAAAGNQPMSASPAPGDPVMKSGGLFASLMGSASPAIAQRAKYLQGVVESGKFDPTVMQRYAEQLTSQEAALTARADAAKNAQAGKIEIRNMFPTGTATADKLVSVVGEDGKAKYVKQSDAEGMTPFSPSMHGGAASGREAIFNKRIILSANQAMKDLENVVQLPLTASTGYFGGRKQGTGLLDAGKESLANTMTSQEVQSYNAMATGFQRSLATIESAGLMPSGSLTHQMDAVIFKEGDSNLTKLHKLAQTRQIVESGLEVLEADDRVSPEVKTQVKQIIGRVQKSVPFTHTDLIKLSNAQQSNPETTLKDIMPKGESNDIGSQVRASGIAYEPDKYDYRVTDGKVQRKAK